MESNIKIKDTPKLNISSAVFGDKDIAGDSTGSIRNIHKTLSKLSGHVRKSLIRIKGLEEKFSKIESKTEVNSEKITRIKKILQTQKGNVGKKLPGGSNVNQSLVETNRILVEIQKQIATAFGMRNAEEKEKNKTLKQEKSKEKLRLKEGAIESVRKIGGAIKKTAQFVAAPFKGFFDKILEFISLLGLGIGANAVFKWFEDEENRRKLSKFFNIIVSNWKLIRNILGVIGGGVILGKLAGIAAIVGKVLAVLASPIILKFLAIAGTAAFLSFIAKKALTNLAGGEAFLEAHKVAEDELRSTGVDTFGDKGRIRNPDYKPAIGPGGTSSGGPQYLDVMISGTDEQKEAFKKYDSRRKEIERLRSQRDAELKGITDVQKKAEIEIKFENLLEKRAMGGPVSAKTPYLVGEEGPEIFAPNVDGSIINNMRTEKIYQMISSKDAGKINFITMELPPKVMKKEQQDSTQQTASPVPSISPVNGSNPYMNTTPEIYGIYV